MSRFPKFLSLVLLSVLLGSATAAAEDVTAGAKVFKKCAACHAVGDNAKNKVGPHLNDLFGRQAGALEGYKYSEAMASAGEDGLIWTNETVDQFVAKPKMLIKKTKMVFGGLRNEKHRFNLIAYLRTYGAQADANASTDKQVAVPSKPKVTPAAVSSGGHFNLGRPAHEEEIAAWDIDIRPDGKGLPVGRGTVAEGEPLYSEQCAYCHGDFGEGVDRWPVLAGGQGTLEDDRPEKTIGSYWPYTSTVYDYIRRAMPFGNARSLSDDEVYALTAYVLYLNDIVTDEEFELSNENFTSVRLPNEANFIDDTRTAEPHYQSGQEPCMQNCKPEPAKLMMRARVLDVTPDGDFEGSLD